MTETTKRRFSTEPSTDRKILANVLKLKLLDEGQESVTYGELTAAIGGRDVRNGANGLLRGARLDLLREHQRCTVVVRGEGIRLSADPAGCLAHDRKLRHRAAGRASRKAECVLADEGLPNEQRRDVLAEKAIAEVERQFGSQKALAAVSKRIDALAPKDLAMLTTADTVLDQFRKKSE
jgi:hypothetical protein